MAVLGMCLDVFFIDRSRDHCMRPLSSLVPGCCGAGGVLGLLFPFRSPPLLWVTPKLGPPIVLVCVVSRTSYRHQFNSGIGEHTVTASVQTRRSWVRVDSRAVRLFCSLWCVHPVGRRCYAIMCCICMPTGLCFLTGLFDWPATGRVVFDDLLVVSARCRRLVVCQFSIERCVLIYPDYR